MAIEDAFVLGRDAPHRARRGARRPPAARAADRAEAVAQGPRARAPATLGMSRRRRRSSSSTSAGRPRSWAGGLPRRAGGARQTRSMAGARAGLPRDAPRLPPPAARILATSARATRRAPAPPPRPARPSARALFRAVPRTRPSRSGAGDRRGSYKEMPSDADEQLPRRSRHRAVMARGGGPGGRVRLPNGARGADAPTKPRSRRPTTRISAGRRGGAARVAIGVASPMIVSRSPRGRRGDRDVAVGDAPRRRSPRPGCAAARGAAPAPLAGLGLARRATRLRRPRTLGAAASPRARRADPPSCRRRRRGAESSREPQAEEEVDSRATVAHLPAGCTQAPWADVRCDGVGTIAAIARELRRDASSGRDRTTAPGRGGGARLARRGAAPTAEDEQGIARLRSRLAASQRAARRDGALGARRIIRRRLQRATQSRVAARALIARAAAPPASTRAARAGGARVSRDAAALAAPARFVDGEVASRTSRRRAHTRRRRTAIASEALRCLSARRDAGRVRTAHTRAAACEIKPRAGARCSATGASAIGCGARRASAGDRARGGATTVPRAVRAERPSPPASSRTARLRPPSAIRRWLVGADVRLARRAATRAPLSARVHGGARLSALGRRRAVGGPRRRLWQGGCRRRRHPGKARADFAPPSSHGSSGPGGRRLVVDRDRSSVGSFGRAKSTLGTLDAGSKHRRRARTPSGGGGALRAAAASRSCPTPRSRGSGGVARTRGVGAARFMRLAVAASRRGVRRASRGAAGRPIASRIARTPHAAGAVPGARPADARRTPLRGIVAAHLRRRRPCRVERAVAVAALRPTAVALRSTPARRGLPSTRRPAPRETRRGAPSPPAGARRSSGRGRQQLEATPPSEPHLVAVGLGHPGVAARSLRTAKAHAADLADRASQPNALGEGRATPASCGSSLLRRDRGRRASPFVVLRELSRQRELPRPGGRAALRRAWRRVVVELFESASGPIAARASASATGSVDKPSCSRPFGAEELRRLGPAQAEEEPDGREPNSLDKVRAAPLRRAALRERPRFDVQAFERLLHGACLGLLVTRDNLLPVPAQGCPDAPPSTLSGGLPTTAHARPRDVDAGRRSSHRGRWELWLSMRDHGHPLAERLATFEGDRAGARPTRRRRAASISTSSTPVGRVRHRGGRVPSTSGARSSSPRAALGRANSLAASSPRRPPAALRYTARACGGSRSSRRTHEVPSGSAGARSCSSRALDDGGFFAARRPPAHRRRQPAADADALVDARGEPRPAPPTTAAPTRLTSSSHSTVSKRAIASRRRRRGPSAVSSVVAVDAGAPTDADADDDARPPSSTPPCERRQSGGVGATDRRHCRRRRVATARLFPCLREARGELAKSSGVARIRRRRPGTARRAAHAADGADRRTPRLAEPPRRREAIFTHEPPRGTPTRFRSANASSCCAPGRSEYRRQRAKEGLAGVPVRPDGSAQRPSTRRGRTPSPPAEVRGAPRAAPTRAPPDLLDAGGRRLGRARPTARPPLSPRRLASAVQTPAAHRARSRRSTRGKAAQLAVGARALSPSSAAAQRDDRAPRRAQKAYVEANELLAHTASATSASAAGCGEWMPPSAASFAAPSFGAEPRVGSPRASAAAPRARAPAGAHKPAASPARRRAVAAGRASGGRRGDARVDGTRAHHHDGLKPQDEIFRRRRASRSTTRRRGSRSAAPAVDGRRDRRRRRLEKATPARTPNHAVGKSPATTHT